MILDGVFSDGTKRLMFCVASHYVATLGKENRKEAVKATWEWVKRQESNSVSSGSVWASVHSSNGTVGCNLRHDLLEEQGIDIGDDCKWE